MAHRNYDDAWDLMMSALNLRKEGLSVPKIAERFGVTDRYIFKMFARARLEGFDTEKGKI